MREVVCVYVCVCVRGCVHVYVCVKSVCEGERETNIVSICYHCYVCMYVIVTTDHGAASSNYK